MEAVFYLEELDQLYICSRGTQSVIFPTDLGSIKFKAIYLGLL